MKTETKSGFTIIEVILFLAVSGALVAGVLVGSSATLSRQRYKDSVSSIKGAIQEQYGLTTNVINSEKTNPVCAKASGSIALGTEGTVPRGTSDCLVMGRLMLVEPTKLTAYNVVGMAKSEDQGNDDILELQNYDYTLVEPDSYDVAWGARIVRPRKAGDMTASILILRSPLSGSILTFVDDRGSLKPAELISSSNTAKKDFCVDPDGLVGTSSLQSVSISANASSSSAVEVPLEKDNVCN